MLLSILVLVRIALSGAWIPTGFETVPMRRSPSQRRNARSARTSEIFLGGTASSPAKTVIVGGGPAGLATALALARRGWKEIHVYDRLAEPPDPDDQLAWSDTSRFYLIGLGGRGQKALQSLGVWEEVQRYTTAVVGRKDWDPGAGPDDGVEKIYKDRPYTTEVLARDRLAGILLRAVRQRHGDVIKLRYGVECTGATWSTDTAGEEVANLKLQHSQVDGEPFEESTPLLIGADGATRAIADALEADPHKHLTKQRIRVTRYDDDNVRVYKTVPMKVPKGWRFDINYSSRSKDGRVVFDALPADKNGNYCGVLLLRESDPMAQADTSAMDLRSLLDEYVPQFSALVADSTLESVAKRPPSRLPKFRYVGPQIHRGSSTVLLGDAIHTVKPYFGLGANSALEDVSILSATLDAAGDEIAPALSNFTNLRAKEAKALVRISRALDRPGLLGFVSFVLPLILDVISNKLAPWLFAPNTIAMLQRDGMTFCDVLRRKRRDRAVQVALLSAAALAIKQVATLASTVLVKLFKLAPGRLAGGSALVAALLAVIALRGAIASRDMAPADVLAKSGGDVVPKGAAT